VRGSGSGDYSKRSGGREEVDPNKVSCPDEGRVLESCCGHAEVPQVSEGWLAY
jgi:hypothetical protein